jgi:hypothetical protein
MKKFVIILFLGLFWLSGFSQTTMSGLYYPYQRNPKKCMNWAQGANTGIYAKTNTTTFTASNGANFWSQVGMTGATASAVSNDTYVTVCDITGSGFLYNVIGINQVGVGDSGIKITLDGVVYTFETTGNVITTGYRMYVGNLLLGSAATATYLSEHLGVGSQADAGMASVESNGLMKVLSAVLVPSSMALKSYNIQGVRFDVSLKVECKTEVITGSGELDKCGAQYILDL